ncbi:MAG: hypothetical protein MJ154_02325 [Candidatus Saccharibacteria bacterium]|nr:hypothetical protein [Candidatus Saccharibacteria bacterium]
MSAGESGHRYRRKNDPYNGMENPEIRPDYIARQELSDAEKSAAEDTQGSYKRPSDRAIDRLKSVEHDRTRKFSKDFRNSVVGKREAIRVGRGKKDKSKEDGKGGGFFKKRLAPVTIITSLLLGGGALFYASQSILGPHLSSLYTEATDLQFSSYNSRNTRIFKYLINGGDQIKISNFSQKYTTFSPYLKSRLRKNGIDVGKIDADGNFKPTNGISTSKTVLKYNDEIIDAGSFQNKFASDPNFREAYYKAKRGRVAGFFDDSADYYYKKKGATRDIFDQYKSTGDSDTDTKNFKDTVSDRVTGTDGNLNTVNRHKDEETGEDKVGKNGDDLDTNKISGDTPEMKARSMVNSIAGKISNVGVPLCSAMRIANMAAVTVSAYTIFQSISYFLSLMEPISKMMAGEGDASAVNETLNFLTGETTSQVQYINDDGSSTTKDVTGSPLQSTGAKLILGNTPSSSKESAPYSIKNVTRAATTIAVSTGATNVVCDGVQAASAVVSLVSNAVPGGTLAKFVISAVAHTVGGIALTGIVGAIISSIIPYVAKVFASNIFETYTGVPAGELFSQGAANANFRLSTQGSAYMPASEDYIKRQNAEIALANAQEAEIDRLHRSPFDITSKNTFLGSLLSKFAFMSYSNSTFSAVSNFATTLTNSLSVLNPIASAYDDPNIYTAKYSDCTNALDNTVCDIYDQEIVGMDYSTIDLAPDDPTYVSVIEPNLDSKGNIKDNSELAKFINVCVERESPWGVLDANIMNSLQTDLGTVGNNLFLVNDVLDIINAAEDVANRGWGTGDNCRMGSDNPRWDSEFKYYQRYIEDMRILGNMTDEEDSNPVLAYEKKYEAEHPIDTSFEGTLARISGQTKDDIAFLIEFNNYATRIANYDPSERYAFSKNAAPKEIKIESSSFETTPVIAQHIEKIFIDKRNYLV